MKKFLKLGVCGGVLVLLSSCFAGMVDSGVKDAAITDPSSPSPSSPSALIGTVSLTTTPVTQSVSALVVQATASDDMEGYDVKAYDIDAGLLLYEGESQVGGSFELVPVASEGGSTSTIVDERLLSSVGATLRMLLVAKKGDAEIRKLYELDKFDPTETNDSGTMDIDTTASALLVNFDIQDLVDDDNFQLGLTPLSTATYDLQNSYQLYHALFNSATMADVQGSTISGQLILLSSLLYQGIRESRASEVLQSFQKICKGKGVGVEDNSEFFTSLLTRFAQDHGQDPQFFVAQFDEAATDFKYVRTVIKDANKKGDFIPSIISAGSDGVGSFTKFVRNIHTTDIATIDINKVHTFFKSAISGNYLNSFSDSMAGVLSAIAGSGGADPLSEDLATFLNIKNIDGLFTCQSKKMGHDAIKKAATLLDTTMIGFRTMNGTESVVDTKFFQSVVAYSGYDSVQSKKNVSNDKAVELATYISKNMDNMDSCAGSFPEPDFFPSPTAFAQNIPLDIIPSATFTEKLDPASVNTDTFYLMEGDSYVKGVSLYAETTYNGSVVGKALFMPAVPLSLNTEYTLILTTGIENFVNVPVLSQKASVSFTTNQAMTIPTNLMAIGAHQKVILTWSKTSGATGYEIYRDSNLITTIGDVATYVDSGLTNGTTYQYKIAATRVGDTTALTGAVSAIPMNFIEDGMIGYWRFDGNGDNDVIGGPDAVTAGGASYNASGGQLDGYAHVDTGSDYLTIPYDASFDLSTDFTIEFWFRQFAERSFLQALIYKGSPINNYNFFIYRQLWNQYNFGPVITGYTSSDTGYWKQTSNPNQLSHGDWHHVVYTKKSTGSAYYLDGKLIHSALYTDPAKTPATDIYIATSAVNTDIDNLRIYNRGLSQTEVLTNFNQDN
jgi:hypothetical protein